MGRLHCSDLQTRWYCTSIVTVPLLGSVGSASLECELVATINTTDGTKASMSPNVCSNRGQVLECMFVLKKVLLWLLFESLLKQQTCGRDIYEVWSNRYLVDFVL